MLTSNSSRKISGIVAPVHVGTKAIIDTGADSITIIAFQAADRLSNPAAVTANPLKTPKNSSGIPSIAKSIIVLDRLAAVTTIANAVKPLATKE